MTHHRKKRKIYKQRNIRSNGKNMSFKDGVIAVILLGCGVVLLLVTVYLILEKLIKDQAIIYVFMLGTAMLFLYLGQKYRKKAKRKKK